MIDRLSGIYSVSEWASSLGLDPRSVREWVKKYRIPYRRPGNEMFIDAADLWAAIPKKNTEAKP